jgi:hypothetical protein
MQDNKGTKRMNIIIIIIIIIIRTRGTDQHKKGFSLEHNSEAKQEK